RKIRRKLVNGAARGPAQKARGGAVVGPHEGVHLPSRRVHDRSRHDSIALTQLRARTGDGTCQGVDPKKLRSRAAIKTASNEDSSADSIKNGAGQFESAGNGDWPGAPYFCRDTGPENGLELVQGPVVIAHV